MECGSLLPLFRRFERLPLVLVVAVRKAGQAAALQKNSSKIPEHSDDASGVSVYAEQAAQKKRGQALAPVPEKIANKTVSFTARTLPAPPETAIWPWPATSKPSLPRIPTKCCARWPSRSPASTWRVPAFSFRGRKAVCCG